MGCRELQVNDYFRMTDSVSGMDVPHYALADANKNITEYFDTNGNVVAHYEYSPFGKVTKKTGTMQDDFDYRFSSEVFDTEIGLVYYNYRYYSPEIGRWLSRDKIGERGGWNLYGMVGNDALNWIDYLGAGKKPAWYEPHGALDDMISDILGTNQVATGIVNTAAESDPTIPILPPAPPNPIWGHPNNGVTYSFTLLFGTHEFVTTPCGCRYYCITFTTTELIGAGTSTTVIGNQVSPVSLNISPPEGLIPVFSSHLSASSSGTNLDINTGLGVNPLPISLSFRLVCITLTSNDECGNPCNDSPASIGGCMANMMHH